MWLDLYYITASGMAGVAVGVAIMVLLEELT